MFVVFLQDKVYVINNFDWKWLSTNTVFVSWLNKNLDKVLQIWK
jgi:hypothetical protein